MRWLSIFVVSIEENLEKLSIGRDLVELTSFLSLFEFFHFSKWSYHVLDHIKGRRPSHRNQLWKDYLCSKKYYHGWVCSNCSPKTDLDTVRYSFIHFDQKIWIILWNNNNPSSLVSLSVPWSSTSFPISPSKDAFLGFVRKSWYIWSFFSENNHKIRKIWTVQKTYQQ